MKRLKKSKKKVSESLRKLREALDDPDNTNVFSYVDKYLKNNIRDASIETKQSQNDRATFIISKRCDDQIEFDHLKGYWSNVIYKILPMLRNKGFAFNDPSFNFKDEHMIICQFGVAHAEQSRY